MVLDWNFKQIFVSRHCKIEKGKVLGFFKIKTDKAFTVQTKAVRIT